MTSPASIPSVTASRRWRTARSSPSDRCASSFNPSIPGCGPISTASAHRCCSQKRVEKWKPALPSSLSAPFVLAAVAAVFGFVYWLQNTGGLGPRATYHVQFEGSVPGLLVGAAVLFNGIRGR